MRAVSPTTFAVNSLPYVWSRGLEEEYDASDEHKPLLTQSDELKEGQVGGALYRKLAGINWRNVLTIIIAVVDYFLVYSSISLIGTFFPTEVIKILKYFVGRGKRTENLETRLHLYLDLVYAFSSQATDVHTKSGP